MKKKKDYYLKAAIKTNFFFAILFLIMGSIFVTIITKDLKEKEEFMKHAKVVRATIVDIEYRNMDRDTIDTVHIRYFIEGRMYTGILKETSSNMFVGQKLNIYYDIDNPQSFIQNDEVNNNRFKYAGYGMLVIGTIILLYSINKLYLYLCTLNARVVEAKVEKIIEKNFIFYISYIIQCHWVDEAGREYTFYSKKFNDPYFAKEFEKMDINKLEVRFKSKNKYIVITEKIDKELMK